MYPPPWEELVEVDYKCGKENQEELQNKQNPKNKNKKLWKRRCKM